jgi:hypothetical protein
MEPIPRLSVYIQDSILPEISSEDAETAIGEKRAITHLYS